MGNFVESTTVTPSGLHDMKVDAGVFKSPPRKYVSGGNKGQQNVPPSGKI